MGAMTTWRTDDGDAWKLVRNLVLVRELPRDEHRDSGLYVPATEDAPDWVWGEVLHVGPDCRELIVGDHVLYHRFMGVEVLYDERHPALALKEPEIPVRKLRHDEPPLNVSGGHPAAAVGGSGEEERHLAALRDEVDAETDPLG